MILVWFSGCRSPVGVDGLEPEEAGELFTANALSEGTASEISREVLAREGLLEEFEDDPEPALERLLEAALVDPTAYQVFALAELTFLVAEDEEHREGYLASVFYAYVFLFGEKYEAARHPYDPRFRIACDLYNHGVSRFLEDPSGEARLEDGEYDLPFGRMSVRFSRTGFPWGESEFNRFFPAMGFSVRGLMSRHITPGMGAPLIAAHNPAGEMDESDFLPEKVMIPATAFLRIPSDQARLKRGDVSASLELYATFEVTAIDVDNAPVPLLADWTAPLAYGLEISEIWSWELGGFLSSDTKEHPPGLFMLAPYTRGKIPVVFVHGTVSSPARWAEMFNELQGYEDLRKRYQFWFFIYPSGNPLLYSASLLREKVQEVVESLDPAGRDPSLRQMVVIGHSQGGILTKLLTVDSGDHFTKVALGEQKIEDLDLPTEEKELLERTLIFERSPYVGRAIFIATPQRGSYVAGGFIGKLGSSLISLPSNLVQFGEDFLTKDSPLAEALGGKVPTSVDGMDPESLFVKAIVGIPVPPEVPCHSIIAVEDGEPLEEATDGVVAYSSAHIEEALSEYVVQSGHSCQSNPLVIAEVIRILRLHLTALESK
ncbi:MAG: esterase/lipase family protein [Planctomycetota bacterium]